MHQKHKRSKLIIDKTPIGQKAFEQAPTLEEYWPYFWRHYVCDEGNNKDSERDKKRQIYENFLQPMLGSVKLNELTAEMVTEFRTRMVESGAKSKTVSNRLAVLRKMLNYAEKQGHILKALHIEAKKVDDAEEIQFLTRAQCQKILMAAKGDTLWHAMITLAIHTGMRNGELRALEWANVKITSDPERCFVLVCAGDYYGKKQTPKTRAGKRLVHLNAPAIAALQSLPKIGPYVFARPLTAEKYRYHVTRDELIKITDRAGLPWVTWHVFRHTFASHLVMAGVPLTTVKELMGHTTIQMTLRYAHLCPENRSAAVALLANKLNFVDTVTAHCETNKTFQNAIPAMTR